jgi:hypothetical protein
MYLIDLIGNFFQHYFGYFSIFGCLIVIIASFYTSSAYKGRSLERYSWLNHFISELGEVGVSSRAQFFNMSLIINGIVLIPFMVGLGIEVRNIWGWLGILAGGWTAISCICVGLFPMNNLKPHIKAATSYFRGGLVTVLLFNLAILLQPNGQVQITKYALIPGILALASYSLFLIIAARMATDPNQLNALDPSQIPDRPRFWILTIIEWSNLFSTLAWFIVVAIYAITK